MKKLIAIFLGTMLGIGGALFMESAWAPFSPGGGANITGQKFFASDGGAAVPTYTFINDTGTGMFRGNVNGVGFSYQGTGVFGTNGNSQLLMHSGVVLGWEPGALFGTQADVTLQRDAAATLALRNGTTGQTFRVYNTFTDQSNYERMELVWSVNQAYLQSTSAGTGTARNLNVRTVGAQPVIFGTNATSRWQVDGANGHLLASTDNTYDIGAASTTRPRDVYIAGTIAKGGNGTSVAQSTCKQGNATNAPGDANEDTLFTCNIGAGVLGTNGVVRYQVVYSYTNNANAKTLRVRWGGTAVFASARTTELNSVVDGQIQNRNALGSQESNVREDVAASGAGGFSITQPAIDTSAATTLTVTCQKTVAGDQCGMERVLVEVVP